FVSANEKKRVSFSLAAATHFACPSHGESRKSPLYSGLRAGPPRKVSCLLRRRKEIRQSRLTFFRKASGREFRVRFRCLNTEPVHESVHQVKQAANCCCIMQRTIVPARGKNFIGIRRCHCTGRKRELAHES